MCGRHDSRARYAAAEGETMRLSGAGGAVQERRCGWGAFPWWTLWLIWPVIGLVKWTAPLVAGVYAELMGASLPLLPLLLIVAGLALLARRRME